MPSDSDAERYRGYVAGTMATRIPKILATAEEGLPENAAKQFRAIARAVGADAPMLLNLSGWPYPGWEDMPARVNGNRPSQAPFFDFEYWMYFRMLAALNFAESNIDPFRPTKHRDLERHIEWAEDAVLRTTDIAEGLRLSLLANAHDLSQLSDPTRSYDVGLASLDRDWHEVTRLNVIADNFGGEFVADLVLAIVAAEAGREVVLHVKQLPMFVSDVTVDDVTILLDHLNGRTGFGRRLVEALARGRIRFASHPFWSAPQFLDRLPLDELGTGPGVLNVLKGDLNFRRAIGDAVVAPETPFEALAVLPAAPMLSLRSIKSYCVAGMGEWPADLSRTEFPMDGSIVAVQHIPVRA